MSRLMHFGLVIVMAIVAETGCSSRSRPARWASAPDGEVFVHLKPATLNMLASAQVAISEGRLKDAEDCLSVAEQADHRSWSSRLTDLLRGEVELRAGRPTQAALVARRIVVECPQSCLGMEVLAKAQVQTGDWDRAEGCFRDILEQSMDEAAKARAMDFITFMGGLKMYADGKAQAAKSKWDQISDPEIRAAVESALRQVRANRQGS